MYLYLFNNIKVKPYVILIVKIIDEKEYIFIIKNIQNIINILLNDDVIDNTDIIIISLIIEYTKKIKNLIHSFLNICQNKIQLFSNDIIINILQYSNCNIIYNLKNIIIKKELCNINMNFLIIKYNEILYL